MVVLKELITAQIVRDVVSLALSHSETCLQLYDIRFMTVTVMNDFVECINRSSINTLIMHRILKETKTFADFFSRFTNIKHLELQDFYPSQVQDLVTKLSPLMPLLHTLCLSPSYIHETNIEGGIEPLIKLGTGLKTLSLGFGIFVSEELMTLITKCTDLSSLTLPKLTPETAKILADWIPKSNLLYLNVYLSQEYDKMIMDALPLSQIDYIGCNRYFNIEYLTRIIPRTRITDGKLFWDTFLRYPREEWDLYRRKFIMLAHAIKRNEICVPVRRNLNALIISNTVSPDLVSLLINYLIT